MYSSYLGAYIISKAYELHKVGENCCNNYYAVITGISKIITLSLSLAIPITF